MIMYHPPSRFKLHWQDGVHNDLSTVQLVKFVSSPLLLTSNYFSTSELNRRNVALWAHISLAGERRGIDALLS